MANRGTDRESIHGQQMYPSTGARDANLRPGMPAIRAENGQEMLSQVQKSPSPRPVSDRRLPATDVVNLSRERLLQTPAPSGKSSSTRRPVDKLTAEISHLKEELAIAQEERDEAFNVREMMLTDVIKKEQDLRKRDETISNLRQQINGLSKELKEKTARLIKMDAAVKKSEQEAIGKPEAKLLALQEEVQRLSVTPTGKSTFPPDNTEIINLRQKCDTQASQLAQQREELRQTNRALKEWEMGWQVELQQARERLENELGNSSAQLHTEVREYQRRYQEAAARLQSMEVSQQHSDQEHQLLCEAELKATRAVSQLEVEKRKTAACQQELQRWKKAYNADKIALKDSQEAQADPLALEKQQATHAAQLEEAHRLSNFYKNNSEQVSRKNKDIMTVNRELQETLQLKEREVEQQASLIEALRVQWDSFRGGSSQEQ